MALAVGDIHEAIAATRPDEECLVFRDRRLTWADVTDRTRRLAIYLHDQGLGCHTERSELENWQSGQDHLAIYLYNGNEYLESMLGAFKARVAPFNVNYRYVADELIYLLNDARAQAIVYHSAFAPLLEAVRGHVATLEVFLQVADDSGNGLLDGAVWYEDALARSSPERPPVCPSPDDLYILYTGGTTGMPKGVLWRQGDAWVSCFGGSADATTLEAAVAEASAPLRAVLAPPFMHGAGHWMSMRTWNLGGTIFIQDVPERLDPADLWGLIERERLSFLLIVGDAFARPLLDELDRHAYDLTSLSVVLSGGAPLSAPLKDELLSHLPVLIIVDGLGSSEAGGQLAQVSAGGGATTGTFPWSDGNHVLSADLDRVLEPGHDDLGWLAKSGRLALGYLDDQAKTERTYPVIAGVRYAVPGDRARLRSDLQIELHGRDSQTINSGGEKIFAEEVEAAVKAHPAVYDCVVAGRPSVRWGNEVIAIVRVRDAYTVTEADLLAEAERHIARYKLPKAFVFVDEVVRSPSGKADYRWARGIVFECPAVSGYETAAMKEALPQGEEKVRAVRTMFDAIAPRYDLVNRLMTFRLDVRWRRLAVSSLGLARGALVADLASGTGDLCVELAKAGQRPLSFDLSLGMLTADHSGVARVQADILQLPLAPGVLDGATCGFALRNLVDLGSFFDELARVVREGGRIALLDVATPPNPILRWGHKIYFGRVVPRIGALLSDGAAYRYLPQSVAYLPPPADMLERLGAAGFHTVHRRLLSGGITQLITATRELTPVRAVTRRLDHDVDLNGFCRGDGCLFVRDDVGFAGRGVAARIPVTDAATVLASIDRDDDVGEPGCGPLAFGALPFRPDAPGEVIIPEVVVGTGPDGTQWITVIDGADVDLAPTPAPRATAGGFTIEPGMDPAEFCAAVVTGRDAVVAGRLTKVVLARDIFVRADRPLDVHAILLRLRATFGSSYRYCIEGFVGASPELLVDRHGDIVRSHPLAGTAPRTGDAATDQRLAADLIASMKDQVEHRVVIEVVHDTLLPWCSYLDWEAEPTIVTVANVQHLGSAVEGRLSSPAPPVLEMVHALQPTPALGGHPRAKALELIAQLEPFDRGRYGGAVGWMDADGNGTWAVAIRCAEIQGASARLFAGVGVVADSDPNAELAETQAKFQAMLGAIVRP